MAVQKILRNKIEKGFAKQYDQSHQIDEDTRPCSPPRLVIALFIAISFLSSFQVCQQLICMPELYFRSPEPLLIVEWLLDENLYLYGMYVEIAIK